jgi:type I restriction enzyme S subunit
MKMLQIKELISEIITGEWGIDAVKDKGVAVIRSANFLNSGQIDFSKIVHREIDQKKVSKKKLFSGDIIIEKSGGSPTQPVGRVVIFNNPDKDTYLCNNFTSVLRPNREIVFPEYLFYALHYNHKKGKTLRYQNKTTGIINLKLDKYLSSEIHIPPLDDQIRIATLLSKVENLISRRREQLKQLDELLKSVFLEMFGDPVSNEKGWEMKRVDEISDSRLGKMRDKKFITGNHLRKYIGNSNVQWFRFKLDDLEEMDFDERERALFALMDGDLLICEGNGQDFWSSPIPIMQMKKFGCQLAILVWICFV